MNTDARKLGHKSLTDLRKRAVASIQSGESPSSVAEVLGVNERTVYRWLAAYRNGGWGNLDARKRGGRPRKLDDKAMKWIYETVATKSPLQLKFEFALWTAKMVQELIKKKFSIRLSHSSVCRLLGQLGLSAQRPLWRAYQQDPESVERWKKETYPKIRKRARRVGARIFFADEAGIRSDFHSGTTWGKRGVTPIVSSTGARFSANVISAVSAQGELRFMVVSGRVNAGVFIEFLKRLLVNATTPIFLVVDGHPTHRAKKVKEFVAKQKGMLELYFLPPYSPELNPDEFVWNDLKNNVLGRKALSNREEMRAHIISHLRRMQKLPRLIASFFRAPTTCYATI
jgi:transposase